jgi:hypothetical protein
VIDMAREYNPNEHGQPSSILYVEVNGHEYLLNAYVDRIKDEKAVRTIKFTAGYMKKEEGVTEINCRDDNELGFSIEAEHTVSSKVDLINEKLKEFGITIDDLITGQDNI